MTRKMKKLTFKNRKTGQKVTVRTNASNITASRDFRETYGKEWGLVMSQETYERGERR